MAFRGHFDYSLDAKNRLNIPPKFRAAFSSGLVLARDVDPCLTIWVPEDFEAHTESFLAGINPLDPKRRGLQRFFEGNAFDMELDGAGRITLPPALLERAGIKKEVVVAGSRDHLEVWDRGRWAKQQDALDKQIEAMAESLGTTG